MTANSLRKNFISIIDSFYFIFKSFLPLQTYRYAVCGGSNLLLDLLLYFCFFHFIFAKQVVDLKIVALSAHIASLFAVFPITFFTGFLLNKYVSFQGSELKTSRQLKRYLVVGLGAIVLNYVLMKFFVDLMGFYPTPSRIITIVFSVLFSYTLQNKYSFKRST
tara:strand:- start:1062 stop:1550 length:489 start_codon:yes stop_codon:yes gene_type:complete